MSYVVVGEPHRCGSVWLAHGAAVRLQHATHEQRNYWEFSHQGHSLPFPHHRSRAGA